MYKRLVLALVDKICSTGSADCRGLNKAKSARELMDIVGITKESVITEIPLGWNRQVVIVYYIQGKMYNLFIGIGNDGNFYCQISDDICDDHVILDLSKLFV